MDERGDRHLPALVRFVGALVDRAGIDDAPLWFAEALRMSKQKPEAIRAAVRTLPDSADTLLPQRTSDRNPPRSGDPDLSRRCGSCIYRP